MEGESKRGRAKERERERGGRERDINARYQAAYDTLHLFFFFLAQSADCH